jgi:hypothetical protein
LQIYSIILDKYGDAWMSTSEGIWHYNRENHTFTSYLKGNGLEAKQYVQNAAFMLPDGRLIFGTDRGVVVFNPDDLRKEHNAKRKVTLSRFLVDGVPLDFRQSEFVIPAESTSFTMEMSMLDFIHPEYVTYEYRLDKDSVWHQTQEGENSFTFSKMRSGCYKIEFRALINGQYSETSAIRLRIAAPWYASIFAKVIYLIFFILVLMALNRYKQKRLKMQYEEQKMRFLINATHDIRSPLTLIIEPLRKLREYAKNNESKRYIDIVERNFRVLLSGINYV